MEIASGSVVSGERQACRPLWLIRAAFPRKAFFQDSDVLPGGALEESEIRSPDEETRPQVHAPAGVFHAGRHDAGDLAARSGGCNRPRDGVPHGGMLELPCDAEGLAEVCRADQEAIDARN